MEQTIEWRTIPSFPNYEASNTGKIRRALTKIELKTRDIELNRDYQIVSLYYKKKKYTKKIARLVYEAFNDCGCKKTIDHIDRVKTNNNIKNLRCISIRENHNNRTIYKNNNKYNLTVEKKIEIITKYRNGEWSTWDIMGKYNLPSNYIYSVIKRGSWDKLANGKIRIQ